MNRRWIGVVVVAALAAGVIFLKQQSDAASTHDRRPPSTAAATVLLFADPREAAASCGCGQIVRLVRSAATRGVQVRELDPARAEPEARRHRVRVQPTVVVLDREGREAGRFEGEGRRTIDAIRSALEKLPPGRP